MSRVMIVTSVPAEQGDGVRQALADTGAGVWGEYTCCSFSYVGTGRFLPNDTANPRVGQRNVVNTVAEERIEVTCDRRTAKQVITAVRQVHLYEEPVITIMPLLDEAEL